jgi:NAD(P)-dependent dehydrogenase (short-subunit alcohol dehydrogenase family)
MAESGSRSGSRTAAITGARGALGGALCRRLADRGWTVIGLTSTLQAGEEPVPCGPDGLRWQGWCCGREPELRQLITELDLLVINHGINVHADRSPDAVARSLEVNALSAWRLLELVLEVSAADGRPREVWVNTSEAEILPAISPLYEISKRLLGQLVSVRGADAAARGVRVRRLVLGPFRSELNPIGVMSAGFVASQILLQARLGWNLIVVTPNPLTWVLMPLTELLRSAYVGLFSRAEPFGGGVRNRGR